MAWSRPRTREPKPGPRRVPEVAAGKRVRYYPRDGEPNYGSGAGLLVTVIDVGDWPNLIIENAGKKFTAAYPEYPALGEPGTWDYLDFRDRLALRLHGTHVPFWLDEFEADATLFDFWEEKGVNWHESPINNVVQAEYSAYQYSTIGAVYGDLTLSNFQRAAELGIPMNLGMLPAASMQAQSDWWNPEWWTYQAQRLKYFHDLVKDYSGPWLELQQETSGQVFQVTQSILDDNGITVQQLKAARQPFLDAITYTGLKVIDRPMGGTPVDGTNDVSFPLDQMAGAPGSVYCSEFQTVLAKTFRKDEATAFYLIGGANDSAARPARYRQYRTGMPAASRHIQLRTDGELRMCGAPLLENPFEADEHYPLIELVELTDGWTASDPAPVHPIHLGARSWYHLEHMANTGTARTSANDAQCVWTLAGAPTGDTLSVESKRCLGKGRGTARQLSVSPWRRSVTGSVDAGLFPDDQLRVRGFVCAQPAANDARCWRVSGTVWNDPTTLINDLSFTLAASFYIPALPGAGVVYGLAGNAQFNSAAGAWALVLNGDSSGRLELRTIRASGLVDTFVIDDSPSTGVNHRVVWGYDSAQAKWLTGSTTTAPTYTAPASGKVRDRSGLAILFGAANDPANPASTVWGFPDGILPFDTEIQYWNRGLTTAEATSAIEHRWPYNYTYF